MMTHDWVSDRRCYRVRCEVAARRLADLLPSVIPRGVHGRCPGLCASRQEKSSRREDSGLHPFPPRSLPNDDSIGPAARSTAGSAATVVKEAAATAGAAAGAATAVVLLHEAAAAGAAARSTTAVVKEAAATTAGATARTTAAVVEQAATAGPHRPHDASSCGRRRWTHRWSRRSIHRLIRGRRRLGLRPGQGSKCRPKRSKEKTAEISSSILLVSLCAALGACAHELKDVVPSTAAQPPPGTNRSEPDRLSVPAERK